MHTKIRHRGAHLKVLADQLSGSLRADDLAAVSDSHQPGGPVHLRTEIVPVALVGLAGMQPHPHPQRDPVRPVLDGQAPLGRQRRRYSLPGAGERRPEAVPAGGEHEPARRLQRLADDLVVDGQGSAHRLPVGLPQARRALHVTEQKGHRPRRYAHPHPYMVSHHLMGRAEGGTADDASS
jgi:hypothetical protein